MLFEKFLWKIFQYCRELLAPKLLMIWAAIERINAFNISYNSTGSLIIVHKTERYSNLNVYCSEFICNKMNGQSDFDYYDVLLVVNIKVEKENTLEIWTEKKKQNKSMHALHAVVSIDIIVIDDVYSVHFYVVHSKTCNVLNVPFNISMYMHTSAVQFRCVWLVFVFHELVLFWWIHNVPFAWLGIYSIQFKINSVSKIWSFKGIQIMHRTCACMRTRKMTSAWCAWMYLLHLTHITRLLIQRSAAKPTSSEKVPWRWNDWLHTVQVYKHTRATTIKYKDRAVFFFVLKKKKKQTANQQTMHLNETDKSNEWKNKKKKKRTTCKRKRWKERD